MSNFLFLFILPFFLSVLLLKNFIPILKKYLIDIPNKRSSHSTPKPRGGGIIFVIMSTLGSIYLLLKYGYSINNALAIFCLPIALIGLADDVYNLNPIYKFFIQLFSSIIIFFNTPFLSLINIYSYIFFTFYLLIVVGTINFINFMDGIDGLVSSSMLIVLITIILTNSNYESSLILIASLLAFLIFNWEPSKIFMGDVGSTFLGLYFISLITLENNFEYFVGMILVCTPLFADAFITVIRRFLAGQNPFKAHRSHLYQRLVQAGWSHSNVTFTYLCGIILGSFAFVLYDIRFLIIISILQIIIGFYLDKKYAKPFLIKKF